MMLAVVSTNLQPSCADLGCKAGLHTPEDIQAMVLAVVYTNLQPFMQCVT